MQQLLETALSMKGLLAVLSIAASAVAAALGTGLVRRRRVALAAYHAFHIVEDVSAECRAAGKEFPFLTKAAAGLQYADEWMVKHGWRPLKPGEQARAELAFKSMHGEQKVYVPSGALALVLLPLLSFGWSGCALFHAQPGPVQQPTAVPCEVWQAAELAWKVVSYSVEQQIAASRAKVCPLPPALPPPTPAQ